SLAVAKAWVAPNTLVAWSRLNSTGSTTITFFAPARAAPWTGFMPTPAAPPPARPADPQPVGTPQATSAAPSKPSSSGILITEYSCTTAYCENVPSTHRPPKSSPPSWDRNGPSGNIPVPAFLPASHSCWRPVAPYRPLPQAGMNEQVTWSPTATRVTD